MTNPQRGWLQLLLIILISWGALTIVLNPLADWFTEIGELVELENDQSGVRDESAPGTGFESDFALIIRVIDGDTVELEGGERVRYIGIDAPERNTRSPEQAECFADEALLANQEMVEGKMVMLERDITDRDRYGRLLRYVWFDERMINEQLVAEGYAVAKVYPPDRKYQDILREAELAARDQPIGLWQECAWE